MESVNRNADDDADDESLEHELYGFGRMILPPTLPTLPLVFRTPAVWVLLSVLRRVGLARVLPTLMSPRPLPLDFSRGVFGRPPVGAVFSASLSAPIYRDVFVTLVEVVVVQLMARRCLSFDMGDREAVLRAITRRW